MHAQSNTAFRPPDRGWLDCFRERAQIRVVVEACGFTFRRDYVSRCPACGAERVSDRDRRPRVVRISEARNAWHCFRCEDGGGPVEFAFWALTGRAPAAGDSGWADVRALGASLGCCDPAPGAPTLPPVRPIARPVPLETPPSRVPREALAAAWDACLPVTSEIEGAAADFLGRRGYARLGYDIREDDLARLTPRPDAWPRCEWWPVSWLGSWRLVVRAWTASGELGSLHARSVTGEEPKTRWPRGADASRLLFADREGLALLRGEAHPDLFVVVVCEGLTDWLSMAGWIAHRAHWHDRVGAPYPRVAVLGGTSGSFPALADVRWPDRPLDVVAAVDEDEAGNGYLLQIVEAAGGRSVRRLSVASIMGGAA